MKVFSFNEACITVFRNSTSMDFLFVCITNVVLTACLLPYCYELMTIEMRKLETFNNDILKFVIGWLFCTLINVFFGYFIEEKIVFKFNVKSSIISRRLLLDLHTKMNFERLNKVKI